MFGTGQKTGAAFDVVCLAASLGGVAAYRELLSALPKSFPSAIVLVQHRSARAPDTFAELLNRHCALPVRSLVDGDRLRGGVVHVVPAGHTATLTARGDVTLSPADGHRTADQVLISAAAAFGPRLLAAVLTGRLDDGALGARHVKGAGGRVLVQDAGTTAAFDMPAAAIATGCVDFVLPLPVLAEALVGLVMAPGAAGLMRVGLPSWAAAIPPAAAS